MRTRNVFWHVTQAHMTSHDDGKTWELDFYSPWNLLFNTYEGGKQQILSNLNKSVREDVTVADISREDDYATNRVKYEYEYEPESHFEDRRVRVKWQYTMVMIVHESDVRVVND